MMDKKTKKWSKNNKWFGKNKSLTLVAIYFHEQLVVINLFMEPFLNKKVTLKSRPKQRKMVKLTKVQKEIAEKLNIPLLEYTTNNLNSVEW